MELRVDSRVSLADTIFTMLAATRVAGLGRQPLLNLVGPPGIGKSHTLRELFDRVAPQSAVAALDFGRAASTWQASAPALAGLLPPDGPAPAHPELAALPLRLVWAAPPSRRPGDPWLLLLDGLDDLAPWPAIQRALIKPVAERSPALIVLASRAPVTWHFWELRDRCRTVALPRLALEETVSIARGAARAPLGRPLHDLALGHPAAVEALLRHFTVAPPPDLPEARIDDLSEPTRRVVGVIGLLRAVHVPTMQRLLARFLPGWDRLAAADPRFLDGVLRELKAHGHLLYSRGHSWIISPALRRAVAEALERHRPERAAAIAAELAAIYFAEAERHPITAARAVNEWLYFSAPPQGCDEDEAARWLQGLRHLVARSVALGGDDLPAQIYRDDDLIARLQGAGRLDAVHEALRAHAPIGATIFTQDADRYGAYADELIARLLSPATPAEGERLRILLHCADNLADPFTATDLALLVGRRTGETVHGVRRDLALLVDRGCCAYDAASRTYTLDPLVRRLLAPPGALAAQG